MKNYNFFLFFHTPTSKSMSDEEDSSGGGMGGELSPQLQQLQQPNAKRMKKVNRKPPSDARQQKFKPFIPAAYEMVQDPQNSDAIRFSEDGTQVEIIDIAKFSDVVLPKFFKHKNLSSFIRQLNMYGFIKCDAVGQAKHTFQHEYFQRDHRDLIAKIERKSVKAKKNEHATTGEDDMDIVEHTKHEAHAAAEDLKALKQIQLAHEERIRLLEQENTHLTEENERIRSAIVQVKGAQTAMTDRLRQLFLYFLRFYVRDGQISESDLKTLMNGGTVPGLGGMLEAEQQRVVNSFLQLQNGTLPSNDLMTASAVAPVQEAMMTTTTSSNNPYQLSSGPSITRLGSDDDYSRLFLGEEDEMGNVMLGRSHSLASNASMLTGKMHSFDSNKHPQYQSFSKDLGEHMERNEDAMKRIDTLTTALAMHHQQNSSNVAADSGNALLNADGALDFENFDENGEDDDDDDDDDEEEALTRS